MKRVIAALTWLLFLSLIGYTPIKIYSNQALIKSTGFRYYVDRPYIQVEKDFKNDVIVKTIVLYHRDLSNPQYLTVRRGLRFQKPNLELNNGTIDKFDHTFDTKVSETNVTPERIKNVFFGIGIRQLLPLAMMIK